jgi:DNA repair protein SbcC/Rad50
MIPKRLTIKGVYSYQKTQVIDFTRLQEANIFGIFGKVGSGKSTILEAMMFALYDEVQRLNNHQRHDLMNLKSNHLEIEFEFEEQQKVYKSRVSAKRDNKQKVGNFQRQYYEWADEKWIPLENDPKTIQKILGLKATDFKKAVVIPQNSFQEFLKMKGKERSTMMCDIFNLHDYDLDAKAKSLLTKSEKILAELKGQLMQLGDITAEMIDAKMFEKMDCEQDVKTFSIELEEKKAVVDSLRALKQAFESQQVVLKKMNQLTAQKAEMERLERDLQEYELVLNHFKPIWTLKSESARQLNLKNQALIAKKLEFGQQEIAFEFAKKNYLFWKPKYDERDILQREMEDLKRVLQMQVYLNERTQLETKVQIGKDYLAKQQSLVAQLQQEVKEKIAQRQNLLDSKPDISELNLVKDWFAAVNILKSEAENLESTISRLTERIEGIDASKESILKIEWARFKWDLPYRTKLSDAIQYVQAFKNKLSQEKSFLEDELAHFKASEQLENWAKNLKEGDDCPLCGGTHHPNIFNLSNAKQNVKAHNAQIKISKEQILHLENTENALTFKLNQKNNWLEERALHAKTLAEKQNLIQQKVDAFVWSPRYSLTDYALVEQAVQQAQMVDEENILFEKQVENLRETEKAEKDMFQKAQRKLQGIESDIKSKTLLINALKNECNTQQMEQWLSQSESALTALIQKATKTYNEIKTNYVKFEQAYNVANEKINSSKGYIEALALEVAAAETAAQQAAHAWADALVGAPYESETAILQVLKKSMNVAQAKKTIELFQKQWFSTENEAIHWQQILKNQTYLPQSYENSLSDVARINDNLQKTYQKMGKLEMEIESNRKKLNTRFQISEQVQRLEVRIEDLKTMRSLFKGNSFVNYASSVHLQNICRSSNERFLHLTQHQLALEVNADNQFMVRDRMNDGKLRSVDTLSGGQMFQASLSLALALADNIQSLTQAKQNFFFLDEGFGSLDKDSLQIVFETLKALRKENRVVGIISHVEDMQMEIDCHLKVSLNGEGSVVTASWEE